MRLFGRGRPDLDKLRLKGDLPGLQAAVRYRDVVSDIDGRRVDRGAPVRQLAIEYLSDFHDPAVATGFTDALADEDPAVRAAAVDGLVKLGVPTVEPLLDGLATWQAPPYGDAVRKALDAVASSQSEDVPEAFVNRLVDLDQAPIQEWHPEALSLLLAADPRGEEGTKSVAQQLVSRIELAEHKRDRERAERVLGWLGQAGADTVVSALAGGNAEPAFARLAGEQRDARAVDPLIRMLGRPDPEGRAVAAAALGRIRDTRAVPSLLSVTQDPELEVRAAASDALDSMGLAAVIFGLASLGGGGNAHVAIGPAAGSFGQDQPWLQRAATRLALNRK